MEKIKGGYYLKARCVQNSKIAIAPPYIREIWDWILKEANHSDNKFNGMIIKRGQLIRSFKDIQEDLKWMVGWRKMKYKKWQCENAMKFLREQLMITTMKTTRGMLITICNYSLYQDPKNYKSHKRADRRTTDPKQTTDTINKNVKNVKNEKNNKNKNKPLVPDDKKHPPKPPKINFNFKTSRWENIKEEDIKIWKEAYPVCNMKIELAKMTSWLLSNPSKKKSNYKKFINNWLTSTQDKGGTRGIPDEETWADRSEKKEKQRRVK